jgi:transposase
MIVSPSEARVRLASGVTDMGRGMNSLALQVQEGLRRDPHAGDLWVFRGARGDLIKILWHDGIGMSLYARRLERGRFSWPSPADGVVAISAAQLAYMLDYPCSWLRVSGTTKMPQIDHSVRHQLHTVMALLFELKAQQQPFEFILPREGPLHA